MDKDTYLHYRGHVILEWTSALARDDEEAAASAVHALAILDKAWDAAQPPISVGYDSDVTL